MKNKELELLFQKIKNGDEKAFEDLYEATKKGLFAFIYTYIKDYELTKDVLLDSYIKIRSNIQKYKDNTNPTAWMFQIAKNEAINRINKDNKIVFVDFQENPSIGGGYETNDESREILEITRKVLSTEDAQIVLLHAVDGYKHKDIAKLLNIPLGTVLWRYNKAIKVLQEALGDYR